MLEGKVLITGGTGTLGHAILRVAQRDNWDVEFTIFSRDPLKQIAMKAEFPDATYVVGDVLDFGGLVMAVSGHDTVIHAAAMKHIVEAEHYPSAAWRTNVEGSINVIEACLACHVNQAIAISTDKACHPTNVYGATKMMMERIWQNYASQQGIQTQIKLVRYGNVFGSNGSFIHNWKRDYEERGYVRSTNRSMTRFWMSEEDAVGLILIVSKAKTLDGNKLTIPNGSIYIPKMKSLSIGTVESLLIPGDTEIIRMPTRPGEKFHETLLTSEEWAYMAGFVYDGDGYTIIPRYYQRDITFDEEYYRQPYTSQNSMLWTHEDFYELVGMRSIAE